MDHCPLHKTEIVTYSQLGTCSPNIYLQWQCQIWTQLRLCVHIERPNRTGRKLKPKYSGLYVVAEIKSSHLVTLRDKSTGKLFKNPVHLVRLNIAYVRAPNPPNADLIKLNVPTNHEADSSFILNSIAAEQGTESNSLSELDEPSEPVIQRRPKRQIKKAARFQANESITIKRHQKLRVHFIR